MCCSPSSPAATPVRVCVEKLPEIPQQSSLHPLCASLKAILVLQMLGLEDSHGHVTLKARCGN